MYFEISIGMDGPFLLIVAAILMAIWWGSAMYQCEFHALFDALLSCSACYWPVPGLFRLLLTCSLLVPLVTGLFRLFRVLVTSVLCSVKPDTTAVYV